MTLPHPESRLQLPSSVRLLLSPGIRAHTFIFSATTLFLFTIGLLGKATAYNQTWQIIFSVGAALACTYLTLSPLALSERARNLFLYARVRVRMATVATVYALILAGISYWIFEAGTIEGLPLFTAFLTVFYVWILLQSYFIATPLSHVLVKVEDVLKGEGSTKRIGRTLGIGALFLPVIPLVWGVWVVASWLNSAYQSVQDAGGKINLWTIAITALILLTYAATVLWGLGAIRQGKPQSAIYAGGMFGLVWAYLLYRASLLLLGYLNQTQPSAIVLDMGLMMVSVFGGMQTLAKKTINRADRRWSQVLPFLVFAFGSIYAVSQLYFILQIPVTRTELSIFVNALVLVSGILTMMILIRRHLSTTSSSIPIRETLPPSSSLAETPQPVGSPNRLERIRNSLRVSRVEEPDKNAEDPDY